jgi:hypothetical protein
MEISVWEPLTSKSRKGRPQPAEQRIEKRQITLGKPVQALSKEGHKKYKEIYR